MSIATNPRKVKRLGRIIAEQDGLCSLCGCPLELSDATLDHIIPRSIGGPSEWWNLSAAHRACNVARGDSYDQTIHVLRGTSDATLPEEQVVSFLRGEPNGATLPTIAAGIDKNIDAIHRRLLSLLRDGLVEAEKVANDPIFWKWKLK